MDNVRLFWAGALLLMASVLPAFIWMAAEVGHSLRGLHGASRSQGSAFAFFGVLVLATVGAVYGAWRLLTRVEAERRLRRIAMAVLLGLVLLPSVLIKVSASPQMSGLEEVLEHLLGTSLVLSVVVLTGLWRWS